MLAISLGLPKFLAYMPPESRQYGHPEMPHQATTPNRRWCSQAARVSKLRSCASSPVVSATSSILRSIGYTPTTSNVRAITFPSIRQKWSHRTAISECERQQPWRVVQTLTL